VQNFFTKPQIDKIVSLALEAGEIAAKAFKAKDFSVSVKSDNSKVSSADIAVSQFIRENLAKNFPQIIICEEGDVRQTSGEDFFLIDPIDGTSSFISNSVEFCVNIAFVQNKKAVFGLIYAPLFEGGKMVFCDEKNRVILRKLNGEEKILSAKTFPENTLRIITSPRSKDHDVEKYIMQIAPNYLQNFTVERLASAVKFFRLLEGDANLYLHFRPSMEWDIASGQALLELMGGKVKNLSFNQVKFVIGGDLEYNKDGFENQSFVASF
jgi:3'(2'), 5'-bisphosphate nucleotidase